MGGCGRKPGDRDPTLWARVEEGVEVFGAFVTAFESLSWDESSRIPVEILQKYNSRAALERRKAASPKKGDVAAVEDEGEDEDEDEDEL